MALRSMNVLSYAPRSVLVEIQDVEVENASWHDIPLNLSIQVKGYGWRFLAFRRSALPWPNGHQGSC